MISLDQLLEDAKQLPADQRLTLAHRLLAASPPMPAEDIERAWDAEIRERIRRYDQGEAHSRSASDVFSDLDRRLGA